MLKTAVKFAIGYTAGYFLFAWIPAFVKGFKEGLEPDPTKEMCGLVLVPETFNKLLTLGSTMYDEDYLVDLYSEYYDRDPADLLIFIPFVFNRDGSKSDGWAVVPMKSFERHFKVAGKFDINGSNWHKFFAVDYKNPYSGF